MQLGAHVSTQGGLEKAFENGERIGANTIQIFGASPRQWATPTPSPQKIEQFKEAWRKSKIKTVFLHAGYLVNLASPNKENWNKSVKNLTEHFQITNLIGANGLIFHVGSFGDSNRKSGIEGVVRGMRQVLKATKGESRLVLENSAGGGNKIGNIADDMAEILNKLGSERAKICFDTAHAFEAGIVNRYSPANVKILFDEWDKKVGTENIVAVHANDSKSDFDSHHDRHENIGKGYIGLSGFKSLAKEKRLHGASWLLEVPGFAGEGPDKKNLDILKSCFK